MQEHQLLSVLLAPGWRGRVVAIPGTLETHSYEKGTCFASPLRRIDSCSSGPELFSRSVQRHAHSLSSPIPEANLVTLRDEHIFLKITKRKHSVTAGRLPPAVLGHLIAHNPLPSTLFPWLASNFR